MNTLKDLKEKHNLLEIRIKKMEDEMKKSLNKNADENAIGERNIEVLSKLYEIEKDNLKRIDEEINQHLV